jgi:hypothetical protein
MLTEGLTGTVCFWHDGLAIVPPLATLRLTVSVSYAPDAAALSLLLTSSVCSDAEAGVTAMTVNARPSLDFRYLSDRRFVSAAFQIETPPFSSVPLSLSHCLSLSLSLSFTHALSLPLWVHVSDKQCVYVRRRFARYRPRPRRIWTV